MAGTKRSSSASDEEGQDHPASAGPRSSPSAIDNTTETLPGPPITGSSNVVTPRKDEIEQHVDPNLDASRTHQCDKAPLSESQNTLRKSEGQDVNAHPNVSGASQCDEPSSSGSSNLSVKSEGEHVDVNPNVSEAPSSSSSTGVTKPDVIRRIKHIDQADRKQVDVNLDELVDHISQLLKLREEEMLSKKEASKPIKFHWPEGFKKLNAILSRGTDSKNIMELASKTVDFASELKDVISGPVTTILKGIGQASVVTAGLLVVAYTLERVQDLSHNKDECWVLIKEMYQLARVVKRLNELNESPETLNVIEEATKLVVEGAITCCTQLGHSWWKSLLKADQDKAVLSGITQRLQLMYPKISANIDIRNSTGIERVLASNDNQAKRNSANFERVVAAMDNQKENLWTSLQLLNLSGCGQLEGKSMDHVVKMNRLQVVHIEGRKQLVDRWAEIQRDGGGSWSFPVISGQDLSISRVEKENIEKSLLLELDGLLTNRRGEDFHLCHLPPNTLILVTWELESIIEEMIDEMQIRVIYIGPDFDKFSTKVKDNIFVVDVPTTRATQMLEKVNLTLDLEPDSWHKYLQIDTRMQVGDEYRPCWRFLSGDEMEEFVVSNCKRYLRLKQLQVERDEESSNIELLTELFAPQGDETTPVFQKNESSVQQDPTANSEVKATCGVDKLEGKTILLEMRPPHSLFYDIRLPSLKEMYRLEKERLNFEIISIPLLWRTRVSSDVFDVYKQFSREVPWLVLQNPWTTITREVQYFLAKHCTGWEEGDACEKWYPTINWIIDPNGRITIYRPPISPGDMRDRGEVFKVFFNYLERQSYQVTWGVNAPPPTWEKIEEVRKNEWQQVKNMSTLEFLFNHLESVSVQVKTLMRQGKFICFFGGSYADMTWFMRSAMEQFRDSIHFIHFIHELTRFPLENTSREYYHPWENTSEMEGTSLLNLSRHETVRFIMRLRHLEEEMNGMDQSDEQLCELKTILHSLLFKPGYYGSFTFFNEVGKMVGALKGEDIYLIFYQADKRDKVQRLINSMFKEEGKEMHDEDSSLIKKMQTASAAAVEQQNADVYFDALRDYISELWGVQLYQLCKLNKEGKKRSPPRVTWPTSRGLCRLKNLLSEGANEDWVKDVISRHSEEDALDTVVKSLVKDIEEAEWAVAGLLAVADLLERFETVPSHHRIEWLFVLEEMFRLAQYCKQFNQKAELWRRMKCGAIVVILRYSIICCWKIDPSKFAFSRWEGSSAGYSWLEKAEKDLREECDKLAQTMTEDLDNESGSLANLDCYKWGFDLWPESEGEGGPSSDYKRSASFPDLWLESEDEGGPSSEYKRSASFP